MQDFLGVVADVTRGDHQRFTDVKQPVYIHDNVYGAGANPYDAEKNAIVLSASQAHAQFVDEGDAVYLETLLPQAFDNVRLQVTTGVDLEPVRLVDAAFEEPDGSPAHPVTDLTGFAKTAGNAYPAGPLAQLTSGVTRVRVW
jgi:hypothetical protein